MCTEREAGGLCVWGCHWGGMQPRPHGWGPPREVRQLCAPGGDAPKATCAQCDGDKVLWGPPGEGGFPATLPDIPVPQFGNIEAINTAIMDEFPALREGKRKVMLLAVLCFSFYLLGLLLVTQVRGAHAGCILGAVLGAQRAVPAPLHGSQALTPRPAHS